MAGLQLSGLASGLDWQSLVDKLIEAERAPATRLRTEQAAGGQKSSALATLKTQLASLQTSAQALSADGTSFAARTATLSAGSSAWSATATADTQLGSYSFSVLQMATRARSLGMAGQGKPLSSSGDVSGITLATMATSTPVTPGEFTVNGARVAVVATDSLQDVLGKISDATGGTVSASYDPSSDKIQLSSPGEIVLGSANDSSNFLSALGLYNNGSNQTSSVNPLGSIGLGKALANANLKNEITAVDASGAGSFSINGVTINYNVNTDSLNTIFNRINASGAGVTASYDRVNDRFTLTNKTTGDTGMAVVEDAGGLLGALGLGASGTLERGVNAQFTLDGGPPITSTSNTFDGALHGISGLSLTATSVSSTTVTVGSDTASLKTKVQDFIDKYNAVQTYIDAQTKTSSTGKAVTTSPLSGNREISEIASSLRSRIFAAVPGLTGSIQRLEAIGVDFKSGGSTLEIKDSGKLEAALANSPDEVKALLAGKPNGVAARLDQYITKITGESGTISVQSNTLSKRSTDIDKQIADLERRLTSQKQLLTDSFIRMESAQQSIQSQLSALNNALGIKSSS